MTDPIPPTLRDDRPKPTVLLPDPWVWSKPRGEDWLAYNTETEEERQVFGVISPDVQFETALIAARAERYEQQSARGKVTP